MGSLLPVDPWLGFRAEVANPSDHWLVTAALEAWFEPLLTAPVICLSDHGHAVMLSAVL